MLPDRTSANCYLAGVIIFGAGLELKASICSAAIHLCIAFYATSKLLIYAFLSTWAAHERGRNAQYRLPQLKEFTSCGRRFLASGGFTRLSTSSPL